jgi:aryl-alcohol dehydrogenase-like predicted oxidoreductase
MEKRRLGQSDLMIAPIMLGGNVFGWTADEKTSFALLDAFVDAGFNAVDTADVYATWTPAGGGASETLIGKWFKHSGKRDRVVLATKVGAPMAEDKKGLSAAYIAQAVEASLTRLQTDVIDLYQSHRDDPDTPQEETMEAYARLVKAGKVRTIGSSNFAPERIASANAIADANGGPRYQSDQPLYNLMERQVVEGALADLALKEKIGLIPYYGLASGFLSGKYRTEADLTKSPRGGGVKKYLTPKGLGVLDALDTVGGRLGASPAQAALAWQIAKPFITAPIVSATSTVQLQEILRAAELLLTPEDMVVLDQASS